jgi:hypothetical protein
VYYNTCKEQRKQIRRIKEMLVSKIKLANGFKVVKSSNAEKSVLYCYYPNNTLFERIVCFNNEVKGYIEAWENLV